MKYEKPEIIALGDAARVIELIQKNGPTSDGVPAVTAYDLDE